VHECKIGVSAVNAADTLVCPINEGDLLAQCLKRCMDCFLSDLRNISSSVVAGGQSYCVALWIGHRFREPVMQASHALWSLGGTIGPFIIARFLVELPPSASSVVDGSRWSTDPPGNSSMEPGNFSTPILM
jgi:hypothetical protein